MTNQLSAGAAEAESDAGTSPDVATPGGGPPMRGWWRDGPRVSRWDRPPEPRDWRFFVGHLGRILIATGLLMFGFVAYQLWGTGIETARAQDRLEAEFERLVAGRLTDPDAPPTSAPAVAAPAPTTVAAPPPATTATPVETTAGSGPVEATAGAGTPPAPGGAVARELQAFGRGDPLAMLEIPAIGRRDIVVPGVALDDLKSGPGHYPDTPLPGQLGNAAIAGHRTTYGAPFFDIDQLEPGDELIVTMVTGERFVYVVTGTEIVAATRYDVVATSDPDVAELTLTSCHPKYTARDRIVVHSVLDAERSASVGLPTFYDLDDGDDGDDGPIPGDDPVVAGGTAAVDDDADRPTGAAADRPDAEDATADETTAEVTTADETTAEETTDELAAGSTGDAAPPAEGTGTTRPDADEVGDAFALGWFHDPAAWPQIALWASVLALVALVANRISRRTRRDSIGILVGAVPFLVALYFFYQNVNRLLPPGI